MTPLPIILSEPIAQVYRDALATQFIGTTVEDWLVVRRLLEGGWTLARVVEAVGGARDGVGDGVGELGELLKD